MPFRSRQPAGAKVGLNFAPLQEAPASTGVGDG